uniref:GIY-YIG endonuclease n=1 Tax=Fusarium asiaticum TaxID=282267 RepID=A0A6M5C5J4_FUSAS|nr:GIY-YIG endonuclease [Fusarium asiaticum]QJT59516.1 GIY-YIG endonuclease [Fusarium asiaticum]QJT62211.1 GIY-YIG endonuclease [Fusarium asiaticum]QJT63584.1 GIY-YIG endonuclease [Fusarium asiaticum]QJT64129.1 GIY-YIG endonuclease [Fusarium asiaticum]QJT64408.1 GIY-YIG endonuclease [Fusarium asiaticum]
MMQYTQVLFFVLVAQAAQAMHIRKNTVNFSIFFFFLFSILVINVETSLIFTISLWENIVVNFFGRKVQTVHLQFNGLNISRYSKGNKVYFSRQSSKIKNNPSILWYSTSISSPTPAVIYSNLVSEKSSIYADNRDKSGIYLWRNKINGKTYVGSSVNLAKRFKNYFNESYLTRLKDYMVIYKALLAYGHENFTIEILEYCDPASILEREQYYLDTLNPKYNILKVAGSSFGYKHSEEVLLKMRDRKASLDARLKMSVKNHKRQAVIVTDNQTGVITKFSTMKQAGIFLNISTTMIGKYLKSNKLFKGIYSINKEL